MIVYKVAEDWNRTVVSGVRQDVTALPITQKPMSIFVDSIVVVVELGSDNCWWQFDDIEQPESPMDKNVK